MLNEKNINTRSLYIALILLLLSITISYKNLLLDALQICCQMLCFLVESTATGLVFVPLHFLFHLIHFSRGRRLFTSPRDGRRVKLIVGGGDDVGGDSGCSAFPTSPPPHTL